MEGGAGAREGSPHAGGWRALPRSRRGAVSAGGARAGCERGRAPAHDRPVRERGAAGYVCVCVCGSVRVGVGRGRAGPPARLREGASVPGRPAWRREPRRKEAAPGIPTPPAPSSSDFQPARQPALPSEAPAQLSWLRGEGGAARARLYPPGICYWGLEVDGKPVFSNSRPEVNWKVKEGVWANWGQK
ncbi:LOW QUALITY PROTEIN: hypothetical protein MC885_019548, partial [Smutsia gigantea]